MAKCHKLWLKGDEINKREEGGNKQVVQKHSPPRCNPPCPNYTGLEETED